MTGEGSPQDDHDYRAMLSALSETERGRWFLSEHARRHRGLDTQILLDAIGRIESVVVGRAAAAPSARHGDELSEIASIVTRIRDAFAGSPESLAQLGEAATSDVLDATERVQEAAWTLRERGADPAICDLLDQRASEIYAACAVQESLAGRVAAAVELVRSLDERLARSHAKAPTAAERRIAAAPLPVPMIYPRSGRERDGIAANAIGGTAPEPAAEAAAWPLTAPTYDDDAQSHAADGHTGAAASALARAPEVGAHLATLDAIDALDVREKLRLFT